MLILFIVKHTVGYYRSISLFRFFKLDFDLLKSRVKCYHVPLTSQLDPYYKSDLQKMNHLLSGPGRNERGPVFCFMELSVPMGQSNS